MVSLTPYNQNWDTIRNRNKKVIKYTGILPWPKLNANSMEKMLKLLKTPQNMSINRDYPYTWIMWYAIIKMSVIPQTKL